MSRRGARPDGRRWLLATSSAAELEEEIRNHLLERTDALIAEGWEPHAARREAERRFGDPRRIRRQMARASRSEGGAVEMLRSLTADLRYALRGLRANPAFAAAVVATLALGIGASTSIFAIVDAMLLRPMPYRDAERWVEVNRATEDGGYQPGMSANRVTPWRDSAEGLFDAWLVHRREGVVRVDGPWAERLRGVAVSPGAERLLGIPLLVGRGFTTEDARPGAEPVAILTRGYWERLGADRAVLGRTFRLESGPVTVVGVLKDDTKFPESGEPQDLWLPLRDDPTVSDRTLRAVHGVWGRMAPGVTPAIAQERADALASSLQALDASPTTWAVRITPVGERRANPDVRRALWTLSATVAVILLIALVNGINLLLVRASGRSHEIAVRSALGASRGRLVRQLLMEGVLLGSLGGVVALALACAAVGAMHAVLPSEVLYFSPHAFRVEGRSLAFAFVTALLAGTALGILPAVQVLGGGARPLATPGRGRDEPPARKRLRNALVVSQVALSMTLLAGAGLLVKSFVLLMRADPGYAYQRIARADLEPSPRRYPAGEARAELGRALEAALEARPEIDAVTVSSGSGFAFGVMMEAEGEAVRKDQPTYLPSVAVGEDYFATTGTALVEGRGLDVSDAGTHNVVVDRDLALFLWSERDAVGRRFRIDAESPWMTVVGVVAELKLMGRDQRLGPYQFLRARDPTSAGGYLELVMRTSGRPEALLPIFEETLRAVDPEQSYGRLRTGAQALTEEEEKPRFVVTLMALLAGIAVTLAAVGLYGVLAYSVARRDRELGIRMALGAHRGRLQALVVGEGMGLALVGVGLGLLGSVGLARPVEALLYEVEPNDPSIFALTAALLLGVAALASLLPARRATRVDPVEVLRPE